MQESLRNFTITTTVTTHLADTVTPVGIYLRLREKLPGTLLLESADYRSSENSFSYICVAPFAGITLTREQCTTDLPDGSKDTHAPREGVATLLERFLGRFTTTPTALPSGVINGIFGYLAYDAVPFCEDISFSQSKEISHDIPLMRYQLFRYVIAINHFKDELYILENRCSNDTTSVSLDFEEVLNSTTPITRGSFEASPTITSNLTDQEHIALILKCQEHIQRGDVFQIVPSRRFIQKYTGDDFEVYRRLRSLNPSPYLFYFDYGTYRIFGSSPEAQLVIKDGTVSIFPIAGTYKRTGDDSADTEHAKALLDDPKESSEHVMLVDLARNDLSIHCYPVYVERFKEVQLYSHVIHLVSKVSGKLLPGHTAIGVLTATYPAGTLTGAPKYKAMELIDALEPTRRVTYGGALGFIGFDGSLNHAITIRTFLSKDGELVRQAGSGIVYDSVPETEVAEVRNKLGALAAAVEAASKRGV
jgi:anthranilate synthase component 1